MKRKLAVLTATVLAAALATAPHATAEPERTWCASQDRIAVLGASSETGLGTTGYNPDQENHFDETRYGWVSRVKRNATAEWGTTTDVYAHGGSTMADFLPDVPNPGGRYWPVTEQAVDRIAATQPDLVIIGGSMANEYVANIAPATAEANLRKVVRNIRTARPGVDIILITHPDIQWPAANLPWSTYAGINHRVATDLGLGLMDMRQYIDSPTTNGAAGVWSSDNAHLADAGQAAQSAAVWSLLWIQLAAC